MYGKIISTGSIVEVYEYERCTVRPPRRKEYASSEYTDVMGLKPVQNRTKWVDSNVHRRRLNNVEMVSKHFKRLIQNALYSKGKPLFVTLTFRDNPCGASEGYVLFRLAMQRFRTRFGDDFSYIAVPELGRKGTRRLHFHCLMWGLPWDLGDVYDFEVKKVIRYGVERDLRILANLWGFGWVDCIKTNGSIKLATYMSKYLTKSIGCDFLVKVKSFTRSKNFGMYLVWRTDALDSFVGHVVDGLDVVYSFSISNRFLGGITYKKYASEFDSEG